MSMTPVGFNLPAPIEPIDFASTSRNMATREVAHVVVSLEHPAAHLGGDGGDKGRVQLDPFGVVLAAHGGEPLRPLGMQDAGLVVGFAKVAGLEGAACGPWASIEAIEQVLRGSKGEPPDGGIAAADYATEGVAAVSITRQCYTVFRVARFAKSLSGQGILK
jgi:hypothetical protein